MAELFEQPKREFDMITAYGAIAALSTLAILKSEGLFRKAIPAAILGVTGKILFDEVFPSPKMSIMNILIDYSHRKS